MNHAMTIAAKHGEVGSGICVDTPYVRRTQFLHMMNLSKPFAPLPIELTEVEFADLAPIAVEP